MGLCPLWIWIVPAVQGAGSKPFMVLVLVLVWGVFLDPEGQPLVLPSLAKPSCTQQVFVSFSSKWRKEETCVF